MKFFFSLLLITACILKSSFSFSQGCSDAGVCSVGSLNLTQFRFEFLPQEKNTMKAISAEDTKMIVNLNGLENDTVYPLPLENTEPHSELNDQAQMKKDSTSVLITDFLRPYQKYYFQFSTAYGSGDQSTSIITYQLEGNMSVIKQKLFAQVKLPYSFINGNQGKVNGMNDITMSMSYFVFNKNKKNLSVTCGIKLPSNQAGKSLNDLPLPMVYQTSLGSTDLLIGAKFTYKKWDFTGGYQHSFNANENNYLHNPLITGNETYNKYFESNKIKRADDGILRINRNFKIKKTVAGAGLLFIYHLANDEFTNSLNERVEAKGSKGLTLNLNFAAVTPISKSMDFVFVFGNPVVIRDARPDGLTRSFVVMTGVKYNMYKKLLPKKINTK